MRNILKRGLSLVLVLVMVIGLLPVTAQAAADDTGMPLNLEDKVILSVYIPEGDEFPGEPAVHSNTGSYRSFNSSFQVANSPTFASKASSLLKDEILPDLLEGTPSGNTFVHGVYDVNGLEKYFIDGAELLEVANEQTMIKSVFENINKNANPNEYEIVWYVIKLQHEEARWFWQRDVTEWHIDGIIKEKQKISINYYGNGNTSGAAPNGTMNHVSGNPYVILGNNHANKMVKLVNGVSVEFLGWNTHADGTGITYQPGTTIKPEESLSLYAMWDNYKVHTATVNTYLDGTLTSIDDIYSTDRKLSLRADNNDAYDLTEKSAGVYTADINGNGTFYLYAQEGNAAPVRISDDQLTIYNKNGSLDVHHYSVTYDANSGELADVPDKLAYNYGAAVTATNAIPVKDGYRFLGWNTAADGSGVMIQPGEEVTAFIDKAITLTAQWEKCVTVTINVTINHREPGGGHDNVANRRDVRLDLVSRENSDSPYLEVAGKTLKLTENSCEGFDLIITGDQTKYTGYVFKDMPGGSVDYTVVTSKSDYDTTVTATKGDDGNWIINVVMDYNPTNFDVKFTVEVEDVEDTPAEYIPKAAIVKVTYWSKVQNQWMIITQQEDNLPGVRVDIDPESRTGTGSYPVWRYESDTNPPEAYGYRAVVTSFVYPDGTIVPVSKQPLVQDVKWTDGVYTATVDEVTDGSMFGTLNGAYYNTNTKSQQGTLNIKISMDLYKVTFDAKDGTVNGLGSQIVEKQYKIPDFKNYVPTRADGYTFGGWYLDEEYKNTATEGTILTGDTTLYAKWIEPLTIMGNIKIMGKYPLNGENVAVNDIDKATEAVVVLQENRNGTFYDVGSQTVTFIYGDDENGTASYSFSEIPNDGKQYRIQVLELNYTTKYINENHYSDDPTAVFGDDNVAEVNAELTFEPPSYYQRLIVQTKNITEGFIPYQVLAKVTYRDTGDKHPFQVISQHRDGEDRGINIVLSEGNGGEYIWKWHTDGTLYEYQMNITKVDNVDYDSDTAAYYITYAEPAYWDANADAPSGDLVATLMPKKYLVTYDLNAENDVVTGVDKLTYVDEDNNTVVTDIYGVIHTWSHETDITAVPQREGYTFLGWQAEDGTYTDGRIPAEIHQEVTLTAQWKKITYEVTAAVTPDGGGTVEGAGIYDYGSEVNLTATAMPGYHFVGWKENGTQISNETTYTINKLTSPRNFVAEFSMNRYSVVAQADPIEGGSVTVSGNGTYTYGEEVTVTATVNTGYTFVGWYSGSKKVSDQLSFNVTVTENLSYVAKFEASKHTVTTNASPAEGGQTAGDGAYNYGASVTVTATAKDGYTFVGWRQDGTLVSENAEYTFFVTGNSALTAEFTRRYTVSVSATEGGSATGNGTYNVGEIATVIATPNEGYIFKGWYENGELVSADASYSFTVTSDRTLTAKFATYYTITTVAQTGGTVSGGGQFEPNASATITAEANAGYYFIGWYDENGELVTADASYSLTVLKNRTFTAKFEKKVSYQCDYVYIFGYNDSEIGAEGPLLRGELAQMIYRLVRQNGADQTTGKVFADTAGQWFQSGMAYMAQVGAINGGQQYGRPYGSVTCGETYKFICLGLGFTTDTELSFSEYATILRNSGYLEDDVRVTAKIQRWEFCKLFNAILGRSNYCPDGFFDTNGNEVTADTYDYTDLKPEDFYYRIMMIATSTFTNGKIDLEKRIDRNTYDYTN